VIKVLAGKNARLVNIDATVLAEEPKLAPHVAAMRETIANALRTPDSNVSVKATTNEKLGAVGRSEGIAAIAIATVEVE
jgi:2-C-methyl-D-erythritol 2,4-cyclodiphosphate synthase